ncbi:MAG: GNAT family N-acetyltransferase [Bacteroidota bacterium]|nr:GNAT family N-acetyltransferase [Bacteroidota bacterium]MDP4233271.1 GNAT family N-acetyltransferase [Bacteroidota bacterium]MDP4242109.1 GNAT family N-acetyltransferase [Bacteroidota bacterium]MDP4288612.1 GNAT family N-acetyltransferase [Bacteroidota bacterium]
MQAVEPRVARVFLKCYARRRLDDYRSPYSDPFEYRSILDFKPIEIDRILSAVGGSRGPTLLELHAGEAYDPRHWFISMLDDEPAGVVFPQIYEDVGDLGSIFHVGILPKFQGLGYGKIIHAHGLESLRALGAKKYVGSTPPDNIPMQRVFRANGCEIYAVYLIEEFENGTGRALT